MANLSSFDATTGVDLQEVDNAINQTHKEIAQRYDFKGSRCELRFDRTQGTIQLEADDAYRMNALLDVLRTKMVKRGVPLKNLDIPDDQAAGPSRVRRTIRLIQGIDSDTARKIVKAFKAEKFKKVQIAIQADQLRVSSASKNSLQEVMAFLKAGDWGIELEFGNYR